MTPAIHAKLQQAHNKLLARSSRQEDTAAMSVRPTSKPAPKKGRAAAQPDPAAGPYTRDLMPLLLYADDLILPLPYTSSDDLILPVLETTGRVFVMPNLLSATVIGCTESHGLQTLTAHLSLADRLILTALTQCSCRHWQY